MEPVILLDTNVISALAKPVPNPRVSTWLDENEAEGLWTSAITIAEIRTGLAELPDGKRKAELTELIGELFDRFARAIVSFDEFAADQYARIVSARRKRGRPIEPFDGMIASIAVIHGLDLATLTTKDFEGIEGLRVVDPANDDVRS